MNKEEFANLKMKAIILIKNYQQKAFVESGGNDYQEGRYVGKQEGIIKLLDIIEVD